MNQQAYEMGKSAYQKGEWLLAVTSLETAKEPGVPNGAIDHLIGNAYMKLGRFDDASGAYRSALQDTGYGKVGALSCNLGRALLAAGKPEEAVTALTGAVQDEAYATPYKAYIALGSAYERLGDIRNAGIAYRNAAIDESNPNPSSALSSLGSCFMRLGRPVDAVEAYRTALDFSTTAESQNVVYRDLALAYVAVNRMPEAVDAFNHATADGTLELSPQTQATYDAARRAVATIQSKRPSDTDMLLANAGYGTGVFDPLDPAGESGELMPSPEDTGFFEIREEDIVAEDRRYRKKHRHTGLKVFIFLLILVLLALAAAGYAYYRGYGYPTQQMVVEGLFGATANGESINDYLADSVTTSTREQISDLLPQGATARITGIDQDMTRSKAFVVATLPEGGEQTYTVTLSRDGIGWKVTGVEGEYLSQDGQTPTLSGSSVSATGTSEGELSYETTDASGAADTTGTLDATATETYQLEGQTVAN